MQAMKSAFAYLRVSGKGQLDGDGFTRQNKAIADYALANGISVIETFEEQGVSGTKELDDRPALQDLLAALKEGNAKVVIIEKLDRLARDLMVQETILSDLMRQGFEVVSVCEPDLCSTDPSRVLVRQIFGAIAQYDRAMTVLKLRGARQRMKARTGRCEGVKGFGTMEGEQATIDRMTELRGAGMSLETIAVTLNSEGRGTRMGKPWLGATVNKIIRAAQSAKMAA
jgi:DNA invertase Pin-like site-specific DNA recombinase